MTTNKIENFKKKLVELFIATKLNIDPVKSNDLPVNPIEPEK